MNEELPRAEIEQQVLGAAAHLAQRESGQGVFEGAGHGQAQLRLANRDGADARARQVGGDAARGGLDFG